MKTLPLLRKEFEQEAETTHKFLKLVPDDKFNWKPHEKSMSMKQLAVHLAELPGWVDMAFSTEVLDFAESDYKPTPAESTDDVLDIFKNSVQKGEKALNEADEEDLEPDWTMRNGDQIISVMTKYEVVRHALNQITHHRAQLGVYLRLLDIPIPGSYGPSADDEGF